MKCANCNTELPEQARFCPNCGTPVPEGANLQVQQDIGTVAGEVVGAILGEDALPGRLKSTTTQKIDTVEGGGVAVGAIVGGEGPVHVGGQQQYGDVVQGDKVGGDKITVTDSTSVAIGPGARADVAVDGDEITNLFAPVYQQIETRTKDPDVDKEELTQTVQQIEQETAKGEKANPKKIERWLRMLALMAPDIWDVIVATLSKPIAGIATVIRKVAEKVKAEGTQGREAKSP